MLFPDPVGATDSTARPASIAATTSAWPGRNSSSPKTSRSTRSALDTTPGILTESGSLASALHMRPPEVFRALPFGDGPQSLDPRWYGGSARKEVGRAH